MARVPAALAKSTRQLQGGTGNIRTRFLLQPSAEAMARAFEKAGVTMGDWRPALRRTFDPIKQGLAQNIQSRGSTIGARWAPVTPEYAAEKQRRGFGSVPLVRTGRLFAAMTGAGRPVSLTKRSISVGVRGEQWLYAVAQNFGAKGSKGQGVKGWRMFADISPATRGRIEQILADFVTSALNETARDMDKARAA